MRAPPLPPPLDDRDANVGANDDGAHALTDGVRDEPSEVASDTCNCLAD